MTNNEEILDERRLLSLRRLLLVIRSCQERPNSYVSYFDGKTWYAIDGEDGISQKNFVLIAQFLTMQAATVPVVWTASGEEQAKAGSRLMVSLFPESNSYLVVAVVL